MHVACILFTRIAQPCQIRSLAPFRFLGRESLAFASWQTGIAGRMFSGSTENNYFGKLCIVVPSRRALLPGRAPFSSWDSKGRFSAAGFRRNDFLQRGEGDIFAQGQWPCTAFILLRSCSLRPIFFVPDHDVNIAVDEN